MGIVEGEVIVVKEPDSNLSVKNKIIVAESTDPGWVLLIKDAKGIIVERGSILSHTAIITRELKKPSIVNVKNANPKPPAAPVPGLSASAFVKLCFAIFA